MCAYFRFRLPFDENFDVSFADEDEPKKKDKRQGNSGFLAPLKLSDALVKFLGTGESELSRSEVVKRIWNYIKENSLQVSIMII